MLPPAKAGVGSAVNDATREAGGTLGVAVIGSVFTSIYARQLATSSPHCRMAWPRPRGRRSPPRCRSPAGGPASGRLLSDVNASFMSGLHVACIVAAGVCWLGAVGALALPGRRQMHAAQLEHVSPETPVSAPATVPACAS